MSKHPLRVVMTGAPCSGKTSAVRGLPELLARRDLRCVVVPETASHILASGAFGRSLPADFLVLQTAILRMQLLTEELVQSAAPDADVILYDRGALDGAAFVDDRLWRRICQRSGVKGRTLPRRYDMVMLLELPGKALYTRHNNGMRIEEYAQAQQQEQHLIERWRVHRQLVLVPPMRTMHQRLEAIADQVAQAKR